MTGGNDFSDDFMLEMFREEAETQLGELSDGLIALETAADKAPVLERLMRAAHSMKGAARIMGIDPIVKLTHQAEDIFVAAQKGELALSHQAIDCLLETTDFIKLFSEGESDLDKEGERIDALLNDLAGIKNLPTSEPAHEQGHTASAPEPVTAPEMPHPAASTPVAIEDKRDDATGTDKTEKTDMRSIRITASALERLAGLAGEASVESTRIETITDELTTLRVSQRDIRKTLGRLREQLGQNQASETAPELVDHAIRQLDTCTQAIVAHEERLDAFSRRFNSMASRFSREVIAGRMLPFSTILRGYPRLVRDLSKDLGKRCRLVLRGEATMIDRDILDRLDSALNHITRNALDHGIETPSQRCAMGKVEEAELVIEAFHQGGRLRVQISDDGAGINTDALREKIIERGLEQAQRVAALSVQEVFEFLFLPGFSTAKAITEISGRGVGLDAVRGMVQDAGGSISVTSERGRGTRFDLELPLTRSVLRVLTVVIAGHPYAIEIARLEFAAEIGLDQIKALEGRSYFEHDRRRIALIEATDILELDRIENEASTLSVVVLSDKDRSYGLIVDRLLGEQQLLVRPLDPRLGDVPDVASLSTNEQGDIVLILDADELQRSMDALIVSGQLRSRHNPQNIVSTHQKHILVVDDSLTVREAERQLLANAGYRVDVAVDGVEAWSAVRLTDYDLIVTDVDMPKMTGLELVKRIRAEGPKPQVPIIIVSYKDRDEDRLQGLEVGANHYVSKGSFSDSALVDAVYELIGAAKAL